MLAFYFRASMMTTGFGRNDARHDPRRDEREAREGR
jgi:hypothetical protein